MRTVFVGRRSRARAIRAALALAAAFALMDFGRDGLSAVRSFVVAFAARPLAERLGRADRAPALAPEAAARRDAARAALYPSDSRASSAVLSLDALRYALVVPVGSAAATTVAPGAAVTDGAALLGFVDRVDFGLARCRLLGDRGLTVAAEVATSGVPVRFALVAGGARGLRIRYATDLDGVPAGAPVRTAPIPDTAVAGLLIGTTVATNGGPIADAVVPSAEPALLSRVSLSGAEAGTAPADPLLAYDRIEARIVVTEDASPFRSSLLAAAEERLPPGSLVTAFGVVIGRVAPETPAAVARVLRPADPGFVIEAFVVDGKGGPPRARVRLRGAGAGGGVRVVAFSGDAAAAKGGGLLVTAPDDGLAPPGLLIGTLSPRERLAVSDRLDVAFDGEALVARGAAVAAWRLRSPLAASAEEAEEEEEERAP